MNCCIVALGVLYSDSLTWRADSLYSLFSAMAHNIRWVEKNMHIMPTNLAKTLVWKYDCDVKLWRHKQRTPNTNDHHMPLNEPPMKIFCLRHCWQLSWFAHASQLINLIKIGHRGEIRGSVLPGFKATMCYYFKLWLLLVTLDCGITAECDVDKLVNTSAAHVCILRD